MEGIESLLWSKLEASVLCLWSKEEIRVQWLSLSVRGVLTFFEDRGWPGEVRSKEVWLVGRVGDTLINRISIMTEWSPDPLTRERKSKVTKRSVPPRHHPPSTQGFTKVREREGGRKEEKKTRTGSDCPQYPRDSKTTKLRGFWLYNL